MEPATTRFFGIAELVAHLCQFLSCKAISRLMQTCRRLHSYCAPEFYYSITVAFEPNKHNLFTSLESMQALARNVDHTQKLCLGIVEMVYYANCIFAYQDQLLEQTANTTSSDLSKHSALHRQRPLWLAPPDPPICNVFALPPATRLTKLQIGYVTFGDFDDCPYRLPSFRDPKATLTYICWIMDSNPHLLDVRLENVTIKDKRDIHLLTTSIFGMKRLLRLDIDVYQWKNSPTSGQLAPTIFFSCPPSLRNLQLNIQEEDGHWKSVVTDGYKEVLPGELQSWEKRGEESGLFTTAIPRRSGPLTHLSELWLRDVGRLSISEEDYRWILAHSPNLTDITIPDVAFIKDVQRLAQDIVQLCPKLSSLHKAYFSRNSNIYGLLLQIFLELPPQQVTKFDCFQHPISIGGFDDIGSLFRRQSTTMREISLAGCYNFDSKALQVILVECVALEYLYAHSKTRDNQYQLCIDLEDAVEIPWGCTRIEWMTLTVAIPDQPLHRPTHGTEPYYKRSPVTLSAVEQQQFGQLEAFYRQLGALTLLIQLKIHAIFYDRDGHRPMSANMEKNSFPGMLNLPGVSVGLPGYLHHLGGLTKLERLEGSVFAESEETRVTIRMDEVMWMDKHWPVLKRAYFCRKNHDLPEQFQWFKDQREGRGQILDLCALTN